MYKTLRTVHLLCGAFALPVLLMYGVSAVQMAHNKWFVMKPAVTEFDVAMTPAATDGRRIALDLMAERDLRGEITAVQATAAGFTLRLLVPGTVHEVRYNRTTGAAHVRSNVAGTMGMLNRLHHAAGLWPDYLPLRLWGVLVGLVSLASLGLGATGLWMWWLRRQERISGAILLGANLAFSVTLLLLMRSAGP